MVAGQTSSISLLFFGFISFLIFSIFGLTSTFEKELRASIVAFTAAIVSGGIFSMFAFLPPPVPQIAFWFTFLVMGIGILLFFLPIGKVDPVDDIPKKRFDEREIMFARHRLEPGSPEYKSYYGMHLEHEIEDNKTRLKPGLLSPESRFANPYHFASIGGSFFLTEALWEAVEGPISPMKVSFEKSEMTRYIKDLALFYGAKDVGVTGLKSYHVYSHVGRGSGTYGEPLEVEHDFAIAFTVEMKYQMVNSSPHPPTTMETGKQYVESARVAVQLAAAIRAMGYPARAHIDGNYRVIAPLVARDAGLGQMGRMTLLMTPSEGPRVRLGVVTTDLELIPNAHKTDEAVIDFCTICEKCASVCPSRSIPFGVRQEMDGVYRWKLNPDTCFRYWNVAGTDCARCVSVCPFSHPNTFFHRLIRVGIQYSGFFRRVALWMDDLFYGKKPKPRPGPTWLDIS